jgi:nucleolar protein 6
MPGNLPFTATKDRVAEHFKKVEPSGVRLNYNKDTGKFKGFAFVEFDRYDRMKTCLKLYHHTTFDDGISPARKINVELT